MQRILRHPLSIRIVHWTTMVAIVMLSITGFYITSPFSKLIFGSMDAARFVHFIFMWLLTAIFVFRFYLFFADKNGRDILFSLKDLKQFPALMKYMLFLTKEHPHSKGKYNIGQQSLYTLWMVLIVVQIMTGFMLYYTTTFYSAALALGGFMVVRLIHNGVFWFFACTVLVHVYLDVTEGKEVALSMFTGYTSVPVSHTTMPVPDFDGVEIPGVKKPVSEEA